jgi:hypothetical protein
MKKNLMISKQVNRLFKEISTEPGALCWNPVTGARFAGDLDPIAPQKRIARNALMAREWFARKGPPELQPLPLHCDDIQRMKCGGGFRHMFGYYAQSLCCLGYDVEKHPSFDDYACGVMASEGAPRFFKENEELRKRFPPRPLSGLNRSTLNWKPPEEYVQTVASRQRSKVRDARYSSSRGQAANARNMAG